MTNHAGKKLQLSKDFDEVVDDMVELEFEDIPIPRSIKATYNRRHRDDLNAKDYYANLLNLQKELIKLHNWVEHTRAKILIICEGRDGAGKGGVIKRITQRLDPRVARVVALPKPTERETTQWYFQRYVPHLPAGGEMVIFDRSWYNRAGVERVMGFASEQQVQQFFQDVVGFEKSLVRSGIVLLKYWFSITDEEQQFRFQMRIDDPLKQWKLSEMDLQSRIRWEQYTKAKEEMFEKTSIPEAPWYIVEGNDKRRERLNCISHILSKIPFSEVNHSEISLPERKFNKNYERRTLPQGLYVPKQF
jgi:polyphosphate kinase 2